ncbi:hypothetical protein FRX31_004319 [Thalictrum thalictroides]|uniref:Uncharacterized protein n=1 Tax=Thalictrum thalictroides TaxID=46969 RepID=A0A7J6X8I7_THATH|nr:hypothetical protein FRX31_004319 [Thalictrum thalictroides]
MESDHVWMPLFRSLWIFWSHFQYKSIWVAVRGVQKEMDEAKLRFSAAEKKVTDINEQLKRIAHRLGIALKSCEGDTQVLRRAVTAGFFDWK